ncbi:MAG: hypothetical protein IKN71_05750 [Alphaproteobacteria bacterium]|nr:hypothetical protein [Alphaproteobacteria bacterium]
MANNQKNISKGKILLLIALLGVGAFWGLGKIKQHNQIASLKAQISDLGKTVAKQHNNLPAITGNYKQNYLLFLHKSGGLPSNLAYVNDAVSAAYNAKIKAYTDNFGVVIFEVSNIDKKACVALATNNWGDLRSTRFAGFGIGVAPNFSCLAQNSCRFDYVTTFPGTPDYPFSEERAGYPCSLFEQEKQPATVYLGYKLQ